MTHAQLPPVPGPSSGQGRANLLGTLIAVAVGAALAVVAVIGATGAMAGDGPGKPTGALVSYDQK